MDNHPLSGVWEMKLRLILILFWYLLSTSLCGVDPESVQQAEPGDRQAHTQQYSLRDSLEGTGICPCEGCLRLSRVGREDHTPAWFAAVFDRWNF